MKLVDQQQELLDDKQACIEQVNQEKRVLQSNYDYIVLTKQKLIDANNA